MGTEIRENDSNNKYSLINYTENNLFELECIIKASSISYCAHCEVDGYELLAFTIKEADIGLIYQTKTNHWPTVKRIPWYKAQNRGISALCFDPSGSWLLIVTIEGFIYILPALRLVDNHRVTNLKWSINDVTNIPIINHGSYSRPSAITWWQRIIQKSHIGIIGTEEGEIIFINLENGELINSTRVCDSVISLDICQDNNLEIVSLLITTKSQRQWRLILEQRINGCIFSFNNSNICSPFNNEQSDPSGDDVKISPSTRSRLQGLKQLSVKKLAILKQKLAETRSRNVTALHSQYNNENSSVLEESTMITDMSSKFFPHIQDSLVLEPLSEDIFLSPQYMQQDQHLFTAYCASANHITIHGADISITPLRIYKMPNDCMNIVLTQKFFFVVGQSRQSLSIISCPLCEIKIDKELPFNSEAVLAQFQFESTDEIIKCIYKSTNCKKLSNDMTPKSINHSYKRILATKIDDLDVEIPQVDTCLVVTNYGIYRIIFRKPLLNLFIDLALKNDRNEIEKAVRLGTVFGLNVPQLFECAGDIHLSNGRFDEASLLYKLSRCRLLKDTLKTAATGHTKKLLKCLNHCLSPPTVSELTTTTRIHLSNLTVFTFSELILRATVQDSSDLYKRFLLFLSTNTFYDERWVVDVVGQTCLWKVLHHLITQRGLYAQVLEVLIRTFQPPTPLIIKYGLLICISEPSIIQAMLATPLLARSHMRIILNNLAEFQIFILQRLVMLYDPSSPAVRPLLIRYRARRRTTSHSSQSSQCDSLDSSDMLEENELFVEELIETFLIILLTLINKKPMPLKHNPLLIGRSYLPNIEKRFTDITPNVDFKRKLIATGYGHAALIRNGNIYTWGNSTQGCLGIGPSISRYGAPQPITVFRNMDIEILNVSCGRCHTLAVTNNGVYAWGGSQYGQLGLGKVLQTPHPELIVALAQEIIVDAVAGQYHSVVLTMDGRVFSWGWGIHGQLGHGDTEQKNVPTVVTSLLGIVIRGIAAGYAHTLTLSADGSIYAFGCNIFGQLGIGTNIKSPLPVKITLLPEPITEIATGYFHNLAVSNTNKVYIWGSSPQVLRLQTQAQKKSKLLEFQATVGKYAENTNEFDLNSTSTKDNFDSEYNDELFNENASSLNTLAVPTVNKRKRKRPKHVNSRDINLGPLEETQTHLKPIIVDTSLINDRIVQISTGCHHSALLTKDGTVYCWGRNLDGQIGNGTRRDVQIPTPLTHNPVQISTQVPPRHSNRQSDAEKLAMKFSAKNIQDNRTDENRDHANRVIKAVRISCGCEFTVAILPGGMVLSWGSNSTAQLGRSPVKDAGNAAEKLVFIKSSKRVVRLPHGAHFALDTPSQVPNIPAPVITYQSYDVTPLVGRIRPLSLIEEFYSESTLHYVLEQFNGAYDTTKIMDKCEKLKNFQACSKLALLGGNYRAAVSYQLKSLICNNYHSKIDTSVIDSARTDQLVSDQSSEKLKENTKLFVKHIEKNVIDTIVSCESKQKMKMSVSRSLDSIHVVEQELHVFDCQGGSEELCEDTKSDILLSTTEDELDNEISVRKIKQLSENIINDSINVHGNITAKNEDDYIPITFNNEENTLNANDMEALMNDASNIINFYINEIDENAQKIWCQVLQTIVDFWMTNNLPMTRLENTLKQYMIKLLHPMALLLFCQDEMKNDDLGTNEDDSKTDHSIIMNNLSMKFCLEVCEMILQYIDQGKPISEYVELLSLMTARYYGPPLTEYPDSKENKTTEQMMKGIISIVSSKLTDPRPFILIQDPDMVTRFLETEEDTIVFTCGHYFSLSIYQSEVIPNMEAELLMTRPLSLPYTAQVLGNIVSHTCKMEIICPRCILRVIHRITKNLIYI